jgi:carboxyl-terminal processing protease
MDKFKRSLKGIKNSVFLPLALTVGLSLGFVTEEKNIIALARGITKFEEAKEIIHSFYFETVSDSLLMAGALNGLVSGLDPYTWYIPQEQFQKINERLENNYVGIGVYTKVFKDTAYISYVIPQGPAYKAGILPGDQIISIDNKIISGNEAQIKNLLKLLRGAPNTWVRLKIKRKKKKTFLEFAIKRETIATQSVVYSAVLRENTGVIKLQTFARQSGYEVKYHLELLKAQGMRNLIFDLRDNGGGFLDVCNELADMFLSEGQIMVQTKGRTPQHSRTYLATPTIRDFETGNLIVLINENSASASELLAGAIQDNDRGYILGRCSYGKGLVQNQYILQDRSAVRITVARYYTPCGRYIQKPFRDKKIISGNVPSFKSLEELSQSAYEKLPDSARYFSLGGRKLVGEGGIVPDIYLPPDSARQNPELREILKKELFDFFVLQNLKELEYIPQKYSHIGAFESSFVLPKNFTRKFLVYAANDLQKPYSHLAVVLPQRELEIFLKASIAWLYFGPEGYYRIRALVDSELQKAVEIINNSQVMNGLHMPNVPNY